MAFSTEYNSLGRQMESEKPRQRKQQQPISLPIGPSARAAPIVSTARAATIVSTARAVPIDPTTRAAPIVSTARAALTVFTARTAPMTPSARPAPMTPSRRRFYRNRFQSRKKAFTKSCTKWDEDMSKKEIERTLTR